jgi:hypothetical protein
VAEPRNDTTAKPSLLERARAARAWGEARAAALEADRANHVSVDVLFRWLSRDKEIAGGVLGGGLAYRFFFWALSFSLLVFGGLGFASRAGEDVGEVTEDTGLGAAVAASIADAAQQSESGRWWLIAFGAFFVLWFSWGLLRALRLVHAAAWRVEMPPLHRLPLAIGFVIVAPVAVLAISAAAGWVRAHSGFGAGLAATLAVTVGYAALWIVGSLGLPSRTSDWTAFVPGALLFGLGLQGIHVASVYYLANKLAHQSQLYGSLGVAATALFALFLLGRVAVWAAELNAVVWEVRQPSQ